MEALITIGCVFIGCILAGVLMGIHRPQFLQRFGSHWVKSHGRYLDDKKEKPSRAPSLNGLPRDKAKP